MISVSAPSHPHSSFQGRGHRQLAPLMPILSECLDSWIIRMMNTWLDCQYFILPNIELEIMQPHSSMISHLSSLS